MNSSKFNTALETGERLYPNTSTEGREVIRQELRSLRDSWESYVDGLNDAQHRLEQSLHQWGTYNENYDQILAWVKDMEYKLTCIVELKNTLPEKKAMLQSYRVYLGVLLRLPLGGSSGGLNVIL